MTGVSSISTRFQPDCSSSSSSSIRRLSSCNSFSSSCNQQQHQHVERPWPQST
ncbi:hypothetical protein DPMN_098078 [Dreissena polymorpha]|uniref:Uncharacterized protein n=1 Tax=Dreissena polymorpha TaxID=45954 RepID=A0A9D4R6Y0_DREPO|nr:hypothetical protein DPMN_098078 [Dreissena polymorpha]